MGTLKVGKAALKKGEDAVDYLFNKIKGEGPKKYLDENMDLIDDFAKGKKTLSLPKVILNNIAENAKYLFIIFFILYNFN